MTLLRRLALTTGTVLLTGLAVVPPAQAVDPDVTPPGAVTGLTGVGYDGSALVEWTNPTDPDLDHTLVRLAFGLTPPASVTDGELVDDDAGDYVFPTVDPGQSYAFSIWAVDTSGNVGPRSVVVMRGTDLAFGLTQPAITAGQKPTLVARLTLSDSPTQLADRTVYVYARENGTKPWYFVQVLTTNAQGLATLPLQPAVSLQFQARFLGSSGAIGSQAGPVTLRVAPLVRLVGPTAALPVNRITTVTVLASVQTGGTGIALQKFTGGRWVTIVNRPLTAAGRVAFNVPTGSVRRSTTYWRVVSASTLKHAGKISNVIAIKTT